MWLTCSHFWYSHNYCMYLPLISVNIGLYAYGPSLCHLKQTWISGYRIRCGSFLQSSPCYQVLKECCMAWICHALGLLQPADDGSRYRRCLTSTVSFSIFDINNATTYNDNFLIPHPSWLLCHTRIEQRLFVYFITKFT